MQGLSSPEWTRYMRDDLKVPLDPREISDGVVAKMDRAYREHLPLVPARSPPSGPWTSAGRSPSPHPPIAS